jgi:hypothetical protein
MTKQDHFQKVIFVANYKSAATAEVHYVEYTSFSSNDTFSAINFQLECLLAKISAAVFSQKPPPFFPQLTLCQLLPHFRFFPELGENIINLM